MPGKPKLNPGWLQVQRERYGHGYRYVPPNSTRQAGELVPGVLKKFGLQDESRLREITAVWPEICGEANAAHSTPGRLEKGRLTVYVDHHVWLAELKRMAKKSITAALQKKFGKSAVRSVAFEMNPNL